MQIAEKLSNKLRFLLQAYGTNRLKKSLWDAEFARGHWDHLDATPEDCVYPILAKYANKGHILDLGCGSGNTGNELEESAYSEYVGVDISEVAINKAGKRTLETGREGKNHYFRSDICGFVPAQRFDVILFRESIYYIRRARIREELERYSNYLKERGVFAVRLFSVHGRKKRIVEVIERNFDIVEKLRPDPPGTLIIVFRRTAR
jgi:SAM-dependent methyltransferase